MRGAPYCSVKFNRVLTMGMAAMPIQNAPTLSTRETTINAQKTQLADLQEKRLVGRSGGCAGAGASEGG
jgi:hypothetical protein